MLTCHILFGGPVVILKLINQQLSIDLLLLQGTMLDLLEDSRNIKSRLYP